ncbi:MAG: glycosyltransferase family 9 protein [Deltaproteobacteria bacterium]|nr:glycosyltransferase family 9 protein [Deltaproteobacteria bacterium]
MRDLSDCKRLLVVKLSSLGDIVHVTPCLRARRRYFPSAEIVMAVESQFAAVVRYNPHIDTLIESRFTDAGSFPLRVLQLLRDFRGTQIDVAIDFQGNKKSAAWIYGSQSTVKAGRGGLRPGWTLPMQPNLQQHAVEVCIEIVNNLGIPVLQPDPEIFLSERDDARVSSVLSDLKVPLEGFIIINPFSTWASKMWPLDRYVQLMHRLRDEFHVPMVITGGPGEAAQAEELLGLLGPEIALSLVGKLTLGQTLCLYRRARLMVTSDSGPMHAAAALGTQTVALFGPTLPERTGPWGKGHIVIQELRPTFHHAYLSDHDRQYIRAIGVQVVYDAVRSALHPHRSTPHQR